MGWKGNALGLLFAGLSALTMGSCTATGRSASSRAMIHYRRNEMEKALPLFQAEVRSRPDDPAAWAWVGQTYLRMNQKDKALESAGKAMSLDPRHSFAHYVFGMASLPEPGDTVFSSRDLSWNHFMKAVECDSLNGNAWLMVWGEACRRDRPDLEERALRKLRESGFLTPVVLAFGRWLLSSLPDHALVITNGDMDTLPMLVLQVTEGLRKDVGVVEREWLEIFWAARYLRDWKGIPIPFDDRKLRSALESGQADGSGITPVLSSWIARFDSGKPVRPLAVCITMDREFCKAFENRLVFSGPFYSVGQPFQSGTADQKTLSRCLQGIKTEDFTGPWISDQDLSPIRRMHTKHLSGAISEAALCRCDGLIRSREISEARKILEWIRDFERHTELGPMSGEEITKRNRMIKEALRS